eukprot:jgi/Chlat1/9018/Chrsp94S08345
MQNAAYYAAMHAGVTAMRAGVFGGAGCVRFVEDAERPQLSDISEDDADSVIVAVRLAGLCGSDLHPYAGRELGLDLGTIMGHELVGTVHESGKNVTNFEVGDSVCSPFTVNCGHCFYCEKGLTARCEKSKCFGWVENGAGLQGAQAQYVKVPMADATLVHLPDGVTDMEALLLGDVLPTGYFCAERALEGVDFQQEEVVVVIGCGPVGLMAIASAFHLGAPRVIAFDSVPARLSKARELGAEAFDITIHEPWQTVQEHSIGRGVPAVMEVVGLPQALKMAYDLIRPFGTISSVGCHTAPSFPFSPADMYNKNVTLKMGRKLSR